jgi:hypothetical protein
MRASLAMDVKREDWENAARSSGNLSELEPTLGDLTLAASDAERAVTYADESKVAYHRVSKRTTLADAASDWQHGQGDGYLP